MLKRNDPHFSISLVFDGKTPRVHSGKSSYFFGLDDIFIAKYLLLDDDLFILLITFSASRGVCTFTQINTMRVTKTVAVVGAGACGIVASRVLLKDGFDVVIFERQKDVGGIWCEESSYVDLHTQQPGATMEFSDLYDGGGSSVMFSVVSKYHRDAL